MEALLLDHPGSPDALHVGDIPIPEPQPGDVRVRVHAAGLNPVDNKLLSFGYKTWSYPFVLGLDVAGTIDAVGEGVEGWSIGDRLYYHGDLSRAGGYAEYAVVTARVLSRIADSVSYIHAAALPCAGFTAYQALFRKLHLREDQTVLIHGGSGGVGGFGVQLASRIGSMVISTASSEKFDMVRALGAEHVIDYATEDVKARVYELTDGRGVDAIVDTVGKASATVGLEMLAFGGGIACLAGLPDLTRMHSFGKALSVHDIALGGAHLSGDVPAQRDLARIADEVMEILRAGEIDPMVSEVISLEEIPDGLRRLSERKVWGKIVAELK